MFGDRLATVSEGAAPDVFERARLVIDLVASQQVLGGFRVKLSAKNVLDQPVLFSQRFKGEEFVYQRHQTGRVFSLGVSYSID